MNIQEILNTIEAQKIQTTIQDTASMYFENNKDLIAAGDFESAMKLGCFDKEFTYYGVAYMDSSGQICYRISARNGRLYQFVLHSASQNLYPTPVIRYMSRCPAPSGHEEKIKLDVKKETGRKIRSIYNEAYFTALQRLSNIAPSNLVYPLLKEKQEELEGSYDATALQMFEGLLRTAVDSKLLTLQAERKFSDWLFDVRKQMEDDIVAKGQYKKILSGFAYEDAQGILHYFYDAKPEVTYEEKAKYDWQGVFCTPVFQKKYYLKEMNAFSEVRRSFLSELKQNFSSGYLDLLKQIKTLPSVISSTLFEEQCAFVRQHCSAEAYKMFLSYGYRWNIMG